MLKMKIYSLEGDYFSINKWIYQKTIVQECSKNGFIYCHNHQTTKRTKFPKWRVNFQGISYVLNHYVGVDLNSSLALHYIFIYVQDMLEQHLPHKKYLLSKSCNADDNGNIYYSTYFVF